MPGVLEALEEIAGNPINTPVERVVVQGQRQPQVLPRVVSGLLPFSLS